MIFSIDLFNFYYVIYFKNVNFCFKKKKKAKQNSNTNHKYFRLINQVKSPSQLSSQSHYIYFKYGIRPNWDDVNNIAGGRWLLDFPRQQKFHLVDEYWKKIVRNNFFSI